MHEIRKKVLITDHAKERVAERLFIEGKREVEDLATKARYQGVTPQELEASNPLLARSLYRRLNKSKRKSVIRVYRNAAFIFKMGRGQRLSLVTVWTLEDNKLEKQKESNNDSNRTDERADD